MPLFRRAALAAGALLLVLTPVGLASSAAGTAEYLVPTPDQQPTGIVSAPDGSLWFAQASNNELGSVTTGGTFSSLSGLSGPAQSVTVGPDGNLWVTEPGANKIARVTIPGHVISQYPVAPGQRPEDIVTGPDHNLWFTEQAGGGAIGLITPSGSVTTFTTGLSHASQPAGITPGPDGNLWFTDAAGSGAIGMIVPATGQITEYPAPAGGFIGTPASIVTGPDGALWFTEAGNPGAIGRIDPSTHVITQYTAGLGSHSSPVGIVVGSDHDLYFTDAGTPSQIGQIDPSTHAIVEVPVATPQANPDTITVGPDGRLWFTEPGNPGAVGAAATGVFAAAASDGSDGDAAPGSGAGSGNATPGGGPGDSAGAGSEPGAQPAAPAQLGRSAVVAAVAGTVTVRRPGARAFTILTGDATIPDGTVINTTHGRLRITSALPGGRSQAATVWGGQLTVSQARATGRTTFRLVGPLRCPAPPAGIEHPAALTRSNPRHPRRGPVRSLWAHDNHGLYSTRGDNSVATVRGTVWETVDTCAGTRTIVARGVVSVRDLRRHRAVLVTAGHSYLARR